MEAVPASAPSDVARPTCTFLLALTAEQREVRYPKPGLSVEGLSLRMLSLGAGARDEMHVLEAEVTGRRVPEASSKFTLQPCLPTLVLAISLTPPVTFRLKIGPGPLFISIQHLVGVESASAAVAMVTAKGESVPPTKDSSEHVRIAKALKTWKRLHKIHGISMPAAAQATQIPDPKKPCAGPVAEPVASAGTDPAQDPNAKALCQGHHECSSAVRNDTPNTGPEHAPQGACVTVHAGSTLQTETLELPLTKKQLKELTKKVKEARAKFTIDEIKKDLQQQLIDGARIPVQILKLKDFLRKHYSYKSEDYDILVQLWQWRLSFYKTYG